ncbi:hypothetical protein D3C71_1425950 [compost metagenome]
MRVSQGFGEGILHRGIGGKHHKLVYLADLVHQRRRCHAVTDAPAGDVIGFAKRRNDHAAFGQLRVACHAVMNIAIEHHVFVNFVGQNDDVGIASQGGQPFDIMFTEYAARWIVRAVDDDHPRFAVDGRSDLIPVNMQIFQRQFNRHRSGALQTHDRRIAVERRFKIDHLIARVHQCADGGIQPFAGAGNDRDFFVSVIACAI